MALDEITHYTGKNCEHCGHPTFWKERYLRVMGGREPMDPTPVTCNQSGCAGNVH